MTESLIPIPFRRFSFTKSIMTSESFTTTPDNPMMPKSESSPTGMSSSRCPSSAPTIPNGTLAMMTSGCTYEPKGMASRA